MNGRENSSADRVSLGQTKRVAIGRAVQAGARVLFLDEPLAGLDAEGIGDILQLLRQLVREHRVTLVIVEHVFNIPRILDLADTVWTLQDGGISVESPSAVCDQHTEPYGGGIVGWLATQLGTAPAIVKEPLLGDAVLWRLRTPNNETRNGEPPILEVHDLVVRRGNRLVIGREESNGAVQGLSFSINRGEVAVFQAPNGWGKTTLLEAIMGLIPTESGAVHIAKTRLTTLPAWERARLGLSFMPARNRAFQGMTVRESLRLARLSKIPPFLQTFISRSTSELSGGERQKLALICSMATGEVALCDEPFSALDMDGLSQIFVHLRRILARGAMLIALPSGGRAK